MNKVICEICPNACALSEGQTGLCRARSNRGGKIAADNYGEITAMALDPIEKKPLYRFHPKSCILSVGSYGCNLRCPFCQNHNISMADKQHARAEFLSPERLIEKALECIPKGSIGVAFTYNEPLVSYEYILDCAKLLRKRELMTVLVTNGYINKAPLLRLLPYVDAMNIDLKSMDEQFYKSIGGQLEKVKQSISLAASECHLEVTTLIIPGENDTHEHMRRLSTWLASVDESIPLHVARFFPRYNMTEKKATSVNLIYELAKIARKKLLYVYEGNC